MLVVSYDIVNNKSRSALFRALKEVGLPAQRSVFEADVPVTEIYRILNSREGLLHDVNDSVRIYRICKRCRAKIKTLGNGELLTTGEFQVV